MIFGWFHNIPNGAPTDRPSNTTEGLDSFGITVWNGPEYTEATSRLQSTMTPEQASGAGEKLTITLSAQNDNIRNLTLRIAWGQLQLMTPIQVSKRTCSR